MLHNKTNCPCNKNFRTKPLYLMQHKITAVSAHPNVRFLITRNGSRHQITGHEKKELHCNSGTDKRRCFYFCQIRRMKLNDHNGKYKFPEINCTITGFYLCLHHESNSPFSYLHRANHLHGGIIAKISGFRKKLFHMIPAFFPI